MTQVVSGIVDNDLNTVNLVISLDEPLEEDEELMIYIKFNTALKRAPVDMRTFTNEVSVNG
jgi:hypothetical protein